MSRYREIDLNQIKSLAMDERHSLVGKGTLADPPEDFESFGQFWDGLPGALAANDLRALAKAIVKARHEGRPVVWMMGAHVIKVGLGPLLINLLHNDFATLFAVNGAYTIHDTELTIFGQTSEDVGEELHEGRFGMGRETARFINGAVNEGSKKHEGFGEAVGRKLVEHKSDWLTPSIAGSCYERNIPLTVHVAVGTDIIHQHPEFSGAAAGDCSARDFRIFAGHLQDLTGAVVINVGSAVILPEVFLKVFSVVTNLGATSEGLVTATFDFNKHYRPMLNVVQRPQGKRNNGYYIVGHHELMLPLLYQGLLLEKSRL
jgi:hypothetical protein